MDFWGTNEETSPRKPIDVLQYRYCPQTYAFYVMTLTESLQEDKDFLASNRFSRGSFY